MTLTVRPPPPSPAAPDADAPALDTLPSAEAHLDATSPEDDKEKTPSTRFVVERRTRGLVWTERAGCALATGVAVTPLGLFCSAMVGMLQGESGVMLLLLSIAMVLGACVSIFAGMAISVFVWWIPRMLYLALHPKVRRSGVRAGVRSRGIWISGIGWMGWNGLHLREKGDTKPGVRCTAMLIKSPEHGELLLQSSDNVPDLLKQVRRFLDAQNTEFQNTEFPSTELMPMPQAEAPPTPNHRARKAA